MDRSNTPEKSACLTDEQIAAFVEGLASPELSAAAVRHLAECAVCEELAGAFVAARTQSSDPREESLAAGARIGRYEILERLGVHPTAGTRLSIAH